MKVRAVQYTRGRPSRARAIQWTHGRVTDVQRRGRGGGAEEERKEVDSGETTRDASSRVVVMTRGK